MADIRKNPYESVTLSLLIKSFGEAMPTFYPVAHVYDPLNNEIDNSPFALSPIGNNLYALNNAFQAKVDSGTFKVVYLVYEDAGHTVRSAAHGEEHETVTVAIQSTTGNMGGAGAISFDDTYLRNYIENRLKPMAEALKRLQDDFDAGIKVDVPIPEEIATLAKLAGNFDMSGMDSKMKIHENLMNTIIRNAKVYHDKQMDSIKQNRTAIEKGKFNKSMMLPVIESVANIDAKTSKNLDKFHIDFTKTLDLKNAEAADRFSMIMNKANNQLVKAMNDLNESIRVKLKFTLDGLKMLILGGAGLQPKQNIEITLKQPNE